MGLTNISFRKRVYLVLARHLLWHTFSKKNKDYALLRYLYTSEKVYWKIYLEDAAQLIMQDMTTLSVEINVKNRIN